jgi:hypothetical protein
MCGKSPCVFRDPHSGAGAVGSSISELLCSAMPIAANGMPDCPNTRSKNFSEKARLAKRPKNLNNTIVIVPHAEACCLSFVFLRGTIDAIGIAK